MVAQNLFFYAFAAVIVYSGFRVVTTSNVVHAALHLVAVLASVAAQYVILAAEFVAAAQVLVYIGAIVVLFLFGIMLTRAQIGRETDLNNRSWALGIPVAVVLLGLLTYVIIDAFEDTTFEDRPPTSTEAIADNVLSPYLVPFLALSFILLAAAIGAIVLARKD
jgi:NADH-quinone oxidoreductase subunit J